MIDPKMQDVPPPKQNPSTWYVNNSHSKQPETLPETPKRVRLFDMDTKATRGGSPQIELLSGIATVLIFIILAIAIFSMWLR